MSKEHDKAAIDLLLYGSSFMENGKRIDPRDVFIVNPDKCHNCIDKQACLQLIKDGKNELLDKLIEKMRKTASPVSKMDFLELIASMREE